MGSSTSSTRHAEEKCDACMHCSACTDGRTGWLAGGRAGEQADGRTDGRTDGWKDRRAHPPALPHPAPHARAHSHPARSMMPQRDGLLRCAHVCARMYAQHAQARRVCSRAHTHTLTYTRTCARVHACMHARLDKHARMHAHTQVVCTCQQDTCARMQGDRACSSVLMCAHSMLMHTRTCVHAMCVHIMPIRTSRRTYTRMPTYAHTHTHGCTHTHCSKGGEVSPVHLDDVCGRRCPALE